MSYLEIRDSTPKDLQVKKKKMGCLVSKERYKTRKLVGPPENTSSSPDPLWSWFDGHPDDDTINMRARLRLEACVSLCVRVRARMHLDVRGYVVVRACT